MFGGDAAASRAHASLFPVNSRRWPHIPGSSQSDHGGAHGRRKREGCDKGKPPCSHTVMKEQLRQLLRYDGAPVVPCYNEQPAQAGEVAIESKHSKS